MENSSIGNMGKNKSSISKAESYKEIAEFWDTHDLSEFCDETKELKLDVDNQV